MNVMLLVFLLISHYLCDYSHLSTPFMLQAKRIGSPLYPILLHAFIHMSGVAIILSFMNLSNWLMVMLLLLELSTHFTIDVLKGRCNVWFPTLTNTSGYPHWYIFGLDQLLHQLVMVLICYIAS